MWIKKFRLQRCWSQEQLAEFAGLSVRTVQRLERGDPASMESLKALAAVFSIDVSRLQEHTVTTQLSSPESAASIIAHEKNQWITREEEQAIEHVAHVKGFFIHLIIFLIAMSGLIILNLVISPNAIWFHYVLVSWLFALTIQALLTFPAYKLFSPEWERRQIERYLGRKL
ncbi:MAG: helix-turn-helix domain-containing protein [Lysobacteraceae bacterium]